MTSIIKQLGRIAFEQLFPSGSVVRIRAGRLRGRKYIVSSGSGYAPILGRWEPEMLELHARLVRPGQTVYDLGANAGIHSLLFSDLVGAAGKVVAFEPLPRNTALLRTLRDLNKLDNLRIEECAVGSDAGVSAFKLGAHDKQGSLVGIGRETGEELRVQVVSLDSFVEGGGPYPDFIKIDVEGAEGLVLAGFSRNIKRSYPTFAIELHTPEQDGLVAHALTSHGYRLYRLGDDVSRRVNLNAGLLDRIPHPAATWPDPAGVWGTIVAMHPTRGPQWIY